MDVNDRISVAAMTAAAGTVAGFVATRQLLRHQSPASPMRELLPVNDPHPSELAVDADQPVASGPEPDDDRDAEAATAETTDPPGDTATAETPAGGPQAGGRQSDRVATIARTVSNMAVGALITLIVLWSMGTWDANATSTTDLAARTAADTTTTQRGSRVDQRTTGDEAAARPPAGAVDDTDGALGADTSAPQDPGPQDPEQPATAQRPDPVRIEIPAIGVSADVIPLGLEADRTLEVPQDFAQTGWWTGGPEPGETGPSVIVGHVDSFEGPAVFFALDQLDHDDIIVVTRTDGSSATFAVRTAMRVDKESFPTDLVYGPTDEPTLRLITCDGDFADGNYLGNLIVTADLVGEDPPPAEGPGV